MDTEPFSERIPSSEPSAEDLLDDYLIRRERGEIDSFDGWVEAHPERQHELRQAWSDWRHGMSALNREATPGSKSSDTSFGLKAGSVLGEFRLLRPLGRGGQGTVWEAEQASLDRRVALKFVRPERVNKHTLARFQQEARAGGRLTHPGIVAVHAWGETNEIHWIAQELVPGGRTVRNWIDESRQSDTLSQEYYRQVATFIAKLCDALQTAHDGGVIHRDVKPLNILLTPDGEPKLTDFGLARLSEESGLSMSGDVVGTYAYMSPEQLRGSRSAIDVRTDVFSLGIVLYEQLALQRPFDGDSTQQIAYKILHEEPPKLTDIRSRTPDDLAVICGKALEKERDRRYASAAELGDDLRRFLDHEPVQAQPPSTLTRARKWARRNPTRSVAGIIVALAFLAISALALALAAKTKEAQDNAKLADRRSDDARALTTEAELRAADLLRLSLTQDFADLVAEADTLWPPLPEKIEGFETWISDARALAAEIPKLRAKRDELRALALPQSYAERERHPDLAEFERVNGELVFRRRALAQRRDGVEAQLPEVDWSAEAEEAGLLAAQARVLVHAKRGSFGDEARGLVLAERAIELAFSEERSSIAAALSEAYFAVGRDEEALGMAFMAVDDATGNERVVREAAFAALERAVADKTSEQGLTAEAQLIEQLERRSAELEIRVDERQDWTFPEDTEHGTRARWWHNQLSGLILELESLGAPATGLLSEEGVSDEHGWSMAQRLAFARRLKAGFDTGGEFTLRWEAALPHVNAAYPSLNLVSQTGLVPIGADPQSGLWEFWHVQTGAEMARREDGTLIVEENSGLVFVLLPAGSYWMGAQRTDPRGRNFDEGAADHEYPVHEVELSAFLVSKYEMTQGQWERMAGYNPSHFTESFVAWTEEPHPVEQVSWLDCMALLPRLGLSLPSEAQWEYACRAGTNTVRPFP
ncbi:MAG: serine/threonine protein kinase, partial [Planctomycetota bacterium]